MQSPPHWLEQRPPTPPIWGGLEEEVLFGGGGWDVVDGGGFVWDGGGEVSIFRVVVVIDSVAKLAVLSFEAVMGVLVGAWCEVEGKEEMEGSVVPRLAGLE